MIPPEEGYAAFSFYNDGVIGACKPHRGGADWTLIDYMGNRLSDWYHQITPGPGQCYRVRKGGFYNIMRRDGTLVLPKWAREVSDVHNDMFYFGVTVPGGKEGPSSRKYGVAHVNGLISVPPVFDHVEAVSSDSDSEPTLVGTIGDKHYMVGPGVLIPADGSHLPPGQRQDGRDPEIIAAEQRMMQWSMEGVGVYFRETDAIIDVDCLYPAGRILRSGEPIIAVTNLGRPTHAIRFVIMASHVDAYFSPDSENAGEKRKMEAVEQLLPKAVVWGAVGISRNSWFRVMDVCRIGEVTQILLLQIPEDLAMGQGRNKEVFRVFEQSSEERPSLAAATRLILRGNMRQPVHPRNRDPELEWKMFQPVGIDSSGNPYPLERDLQPTDPGSLESILGEHGR